MKFPITIAEKLLKMQQGERIPAAQLKHAIIENLINDGIVIRQRIGAGRGICFINNPIALQAYLSNHFGINNLVAYVEQYNNEELSKADAISIASNSKLKQIRSFKGFLVNCYQSIIAQLNGKEFILQPTIGSFTFIYDFEQFIIPPNITIVGEENPTNFRLIQQQEYLFENITPLFISRYPQTQHKDVLQWLQSIPNNYLHLGDYDLEGINIYLNEFKRHLGNKASFFIPSNIEMLIQQKGNRNLYHQQFDRIPLLEVIEEQPLQKLLQLIHQYKKGLEQEALIIQKTI